jgi:hypothetical protein
MAFKAAFVMMAPDGDPTKDRATIKTAKLELATVVMELAIVLYYLEGSLTAVDVKTYSNVPQVTIGVI